MKGRDMNWSHAQLSMIRFETIGGLYTNSTSTLMARRTNEELRIFPGRDGRTSTIGGFYSCRHSCQLCRRRWCRPHKKRAEVNRHHFTKAGNQDLTDVLYPSSLGMPRMPPVLDGGTSTGPCLFWMQVYQSIRTPRGIRFLILYGMIKTWGLASAAEMEV